MKSRRERWLAYQARNPDAILIRARSGRETHIAATTGTSVAECGWWLRAQAGHFIVRGATEPTCDRCMKPDPAVTEKA